MRAQGAHWRSLASNPAYVFRLACDTVSLGFMFCIVPVLVQHVLLPAGTDYIIMAIVLLIIILPANSFAIFFFDKWTPRVFQMMLPIVILAIADNIVVFIASCVGGATFFQGDIVFVTGNIICIAVNFTCASIARSTKENILLFWNINQPIEKPATYFALIIVGAMIMLCLAEWRLVYVIAGLLAFVLPIMVSRVQRSMRTRLAVDPEVDTRHMNAFTTPVFSRQAIAHVIEKIFLAILISFPLAAVFSSPMLPVSLDAILPGYATMPLSSILLVYVFGFFALGGPLMVLFRWLTRRHYADPAVREKIAALCTLFAMLSLIISFATGGIATNIPAPVYLAWSIANNAFFSMELMYIFLIIYDFIPSKRVAFLEQSLPIFLVAVFFMWIYLMADTLTTTTTFFIPGIVSLCLLLVYYLLLPRVQSGRLHAHTMEDRVA